MSVNLLGDSVLFPSDCILCADSFTSWGTEDRSDAGKVLANLVSQMSSEKNTQVSASQVEALSTEIHYIWMKDASWKVQEVLEKFGIPKDQFYSLSIEDVIRASEKALKSSEAASLEEKEVAALQQFTDYANLSEANKLLDDKLLLDHAKTLFEIIQKAKN